jgi:hypothetical protein
MADAGTLRMTKTWRANAPPAQDINR